MDIECVAAPGALLGEGALWDPDRGLVWWVDIRAHAIHAHEVATGRNHAQSLDCRVTAIGLGPDGRLVAVGDPGFLWLDVAADLRVRLASVIARPDETPGNRFNDGKVDPAGRFWAGTMDDAEQSARGILYRLDAHGLDRVKAGFAVPNGPCFLADGTLLIADTARRVIHAMRLDVQGRPRDERIFATFDATHGYPDGMTTDAENHVWVAFWDGGCLRRFNPQGAIVREVRLPVQRPTCPVFGGPHLDRLYVTSATTGLDTDALARQPWAGGLLRLDVGVHGRPPTRFSG
jgi:sugar lactone lactonase YvrE